MSFILNALRKSEQQRQASQADSLENRVLKQQVFAPKKTSGWLIVLVIVNVFFLCYFIWLFTKEDNIEIVSKHETVAKNKTLEPRIKENEKASSPIIIKNAIKQRQISIAEQLERKKLSKQQEIKKIVQQKILQLAEQKKQADSKVKPITITHPKKDPIPKDIPEDILKPAKHELPFLSELDYQFRRKVPDLDINVFVYSENQDDRFIMINMQKYGAGEEITEGMNLIEIRMNSFVVEYKNKTFQIKR
jgi:general secretion pathway protein B